MLDKKTLMPVFLSAGGNKAYCVSKGLKEVRSEVYPDLSGPQREIKDL